MCKGSSSVDRVCKKEGKSLPLPSTPVRRDRKDWRGEKETQRKSAHDRGVIVGGEGFLWAPLPSPFLHSQSAHPACIATDGKRKCGGHEGRKQTVSRPTSSRTNALSRPTLRVSDKGLALYIINVVEVKCSAIYIRLSFLYLKDPPSVCITA